MNRKKFFDFIEAKLNLLAYSIESLGGLNLLDKHLHSENFYLHFFNLLFGWELKNLNVVANNAEGIDLVDAKNKIIVQVSATATKQKIESALDKDLSAYKGFSFKFISISKDVKDLRKKSFLNPHGLTFLPATDIYDIPALLALIKAMDIDSMKTVYEFIKKELMTEPDPDKVEYNLTAIIKILSEQDWSQGVQSLEVIPFDIEAKIMHNQLDSARVIIEDYKIHYHRIDRIYSEFAKQGKNKSLSILNSIRMEYLNLNAAGVDSPDQCFFSIIEKVMQKIQVSVNYTPIPEDELEMSVGILVVDSFIRCKIFKNPKDIHAHS